MKFRKATLLLHYPPVPVLNSDPESNTLPKLLCWVYSKHIILPKLDVPCSPFVMNTS